MGCVLRDPTQILTLNIILLRNPVSVSSTIKFKSIDSSDPLVFEVRVLKIMYVKHLVDSLAHRLYIMHNSYYNYVCFPLDPWVCVHMNV